MDPSAQAYFNSAKRYGLEVIETAIIDGFTLKLAGHQYHFSISGTPHNSAISASIMSNKFISNRILKDAGIPVAKSVAIEQADFSKEALKEATKELCYPLVTKPSIWSGYGADITCGIPDFENLYEICESLTKQYYYIVIEEFHASLQSYRVLYFKGKILDAIERHPATIIGNGTHTIRELVKNKNIERQNQSSFLKPIIIDKEAFFCLNEQQLQADDIPANNQSVYLCHTSNASRGGSIKSYAGVICQENKDLFDKLAHAINVELVGIDIECKNLAEPITETNGIIVEANNGPSVRIHEEGVGGKAVHVTRPIIRSLIYKHPIGYLLSLMRFTISKLLLVGCIFSMAYVFLKLNK